MTRTLTLITAVVLVIAGAAVLLRSPILAVSSTSAWLRSIGDGGVSGDTYAAVLQGLMSAYRVFGLAVLVCGMALLLRIRPGGE